MMLASPSHSVIQLRRSSLDQPRLFNFLDWMHCSNFGRSVGALLSLKSSRLLRQGAEVLVEFPKITEVLAKS
jgi:hypothetical protein